MTYKTVVSQESVRVYFLVSALNDIDILAGDIHSFHLNLDNKGKNFFYARDEWKYDQGKVAIIVRYLYGLKTNRL